MANIGQTDWECGTLVRLDYFLDYLLSHYNFCQLGAWVTFSIQEENTEENVDWKMNIYF